MNSHHDNCYAVTASRVGITEALCDHGNHGIAIELHGTPCQPGALPPVIEATMPRCMFAEIVGTVLDGIRRTDGLAALSDFQNQVDAAAAAAAAAIWHR
ncbi:hypothetical protein [Streptomyces sp. NPDC051014]|uniref:hypothetical protein n=1 Tax=Streptomyces sp. NPDC051014 TaxID=3155751 RepID=UPI0033CA0009